MQRAHELLDLLIIIIILHSPGRLEELDPDLMEEEDREDQSYAASVFLIASWKLMYSCFPY